MARPRSITRANPYTPTRGPFAGQTFYSQRQYDNARARRAGFRSEHARRQAPKPTRTEAQLSKLRKDEQETRARVLDALSIARRKGVSLSEAARRAGTTPTAIKRYGSTALRRGDAGRWRVKRSDVLARRMNAITGDGVRPIALSGRGASRDASLIARHQWAVTRALAGDEEPLDELIREHGDALSRLGLETDIARLVELEALGELDDLDNPYAITEAG